VGYEQTPVQLLEPTHCFVKIPRFYRKLQIRIIIESLIYKQTKLKAGTLTGMQF